MEIISLSETQRDELQEVANIGVSHAATALSQMVNKQIQIGIPRIELIPLEKTIECVKSEEIIVGIFLKISNEIPSYSLLLLSQKSAFTLTDMLLGQPSDPKKQTITEMDQSALKEVGNIMICAFFDSVAELLGTTIVPGPPSLAYDMPAAVLDYVLIQIGNVADQVLVFDTNVKTDKEETFDIQLFLIPEPKSITTILEKIDMSGMKEKKPMANIEQLNSIQLDALKETGNIGCSHAATAVSQMINKQVDISVPSIKIKKIMELQTTLTTFSEYNQKIVGVYLELTNEFHGSILFLFPYQSALILSDLLLCQKPGTTKELDEMGKSAITEVGNVVVSAYTNALGTFLKTTIMLSPPSFASDMPYAFLEKITNILGKGATHALIFDTIFKGENDLFKSYFVLLPSPQSLDTLLNRLVSCIENDHGDPVTDQYIESLSKI